MWSERLPSGLTSLSITGVGERGYRISINGRGIGPNGWRGRTLTPARIFGPEVNTWLACCSLLFKDPAHDRSSHGQTPAHPTKPDPAVRFSQLSPDSSNPADNLGREHSEFFLASFQNTGCLRALAHIQRCRCQCPAPWALCRWAPTASPCLRLSRSRPCADK